MTQLTWSPVQYATHAAPRLRPALDLLARVDLANAASVVDLGCGTGVVLPALRERFPNARLVGVDQSAAMLAEAADTDGGAELVEADAAIWRPDRPVDLIYSNAVLQWIPGHRQLLPDLFGCCRTLAVQVPNNFASPSQQLVLELAKEPPWRDRLGDLQLGENVLAPGDYLSLLQVAGASVDLWETTYYQLMTGADPVLDWLRGTTLLRVHAALDGAGSEATEAFERSLAERLRAAYPTDAAGVTVFPFKRLFFVATH
ncbi:MAG: methyltransferase domain-containing protein [Geminicoccaceae bacterium]